MVKYRFYARTEGKSEETKDHVAGYLKSKNSVPVRASFTLYVMSGEKKKECISRVCEGSLPGFNFSLCDCMQSGSIFTYVLI